VKSVRFERLLASTALGLALALSSLVLSSHAAIAQTPTAKDVESAVPMPDTTVPSPPTAQDVEPKAKSEAAPAATIDVPKLTTVAPSAVPPPAVLAATVADSAVSDKLREMISGKLDRAVSRKADREGVEQFYKARNFAPLWVSNGAGNDRAKSAIAYLGQADAVGLDPADYTTPDMKSAATVDSLADAEIKLTSAALTFARHAQVGRVHFTRVSADIQFDLKGPDAADVLGKLADGNDAGKVLDSYNPPMPEFKALRQKLAEVRKNGGVVAKAEEVKPAVVHVEEGKTLKPGMKDERVVALRKRLDIAGDKNNENYDNDVRQAVRGFQKTAGINADGNLGNNAVKAINGEKKETARGPSGDPTDIILVNMERWRWYQRDLGNPHVVVNIPDYTLTLWNDSKVYWKTKIVAGKPGKNTPLISAEMKFITVNPTWNVPPSIIEKEYLPALREDPQALERIGLKLEQAADGTVRIYQPPGAANALGRIRFNFPNKFLVYQHDTPDKNLFAKEERAFSHGCMRVQNPLMYGEKLLSLALPNENYTAAKLEKMFGGSEININFPKNIWVHLTYQTAFVDDEGKLQLRKDVYGWDQRMIQIMKGSERKVADIAVERAPNSSSKPVKMPAGMYGGDTGGYRGGPNFFDFLFGGGQAAQPVRGGRNYYGPPPRSPNGRVSQR
jgi:murein L,D-transpeptidase YcbB/YkuD